MCLNFILFFLLHLACISADCNITCPVGNYKSQINAFSNATCSLCPPGAYSISPTKAMTCQTCPANSYCVTSVSIQACPTYTHSVSGSSSVLQCRCDSGYACSYSKRISATIILNSTVTDFNSNYNNIRDKVIEAHSHVNDIAGKLKSKNIHIGT